MPTRLWLRIMLCTAVPAALAAQTFNTIFLFHGSDGVEPVGLTLGLDGNFYGVTYYQQGTLFKITPSGTLTTLYTFCADGYDCVNGIMPYSPPVQDVSGDLYGVTLNGGAYNDGTVYRFTPGSGLTTIYNFCAQSNCSDGAFPYFLIRADDGVYYGATSMGGSGPYCTFTGTPDGCGTIFKITPEGAITTLYSFCTQSGCADGSVPTSLIQAADGNFYGTTAAGGTSGWGTVFKMSPAGNLAQIYDFPGSGGYVGSYPYGLMQASDGAFYGMEYGMNGFGSFFRITPDGTFTILYNFECPDGCPDGLNPSGVIEASDGNFYGTTNRGGGEDTDGGTIFQITPSGALTTLYVFCPACGDAHPTGLIQDPGGAFYGASDEGDGAVFRFSTGLPRFVTPRPAAGKLGSTVDILGTDLSAAGSVTFNGVAARFRVSSAALIVATVPAGATSGKIQVTTPAGALTNNVPFRVLP